MSPRTLQAPAAISEAGEGEGAERRAVYFGTEENVDDIYFVDTLSKIKVNESS